MVAVGHRATDHEQQHLTQRMRDAPGLARIVDDGEMIEKRLEKPHAVGAMGVLHAPGSEVAEAIDPALDAALGIERDEGADDAVPGLLGDMSAAAE